MITRESFKEVMTRIKKVWDFGDELSNFYRCRSVDYCCDAPNCIDVAIDLLEYIYSKMNLDGFRIMYTNCIGEEAIKMVM